MGGVSAGVADGERYDVSGLWSWASRWSGTGRSDYLQVCRAAVNFLQEIKCATLGSAKTISVQSDWLE